MKYLTNFVVIDCIRRGEIESIGSYLESTKYNHEVFKLLQEDDNCIGFRSIEERDTLLLKIHKRINWKECIENFGIRPIRNKELIEIISSEVPQEILTYYIRE